MEKEIEIQDLTYFCTACNKLKIINTNKNKKSIKSKCIYCHKKTRFILQKESANIKPINDFCSKYTLAADMTISCSHVHVKGITIKGNINFRNSSGSSLEGNIIATKKDNEMSGNINLNNSKVGSINKNIIANDVNIDSSEITSLDRNLIGFSFDNDEIVIQMINNLFIDDESNVNVDELVKLQEILISDPNIADKLGKRLKVENENRKGILGSRILQSLKKVGLSTLFKAQEMGLGMLFNWFLLAMGLKGEI